MNFFLPNLIFQFICIFENNFCKLTRFLVDAVGWDIVIKFVVCESLEYLLESCLTYRVIFELVLLLELFNESEEEPNGVVVTLYSQFHVATKLLYHLNIDKLVAQFFDYTE